MCGCFVLWHSRNKVPARPGGDWVTFMIKLRNSRAPLSDVMALPQCNGFLPSAVASSASSETWHWTQNVPSQFHSTFVTEHRLLLLLWKPPFILLQCIVGRWLPYQSRISGESEICKWVRSPLLAHLLHNAPWQMSEKALPAHCVPFPCERDLKLQGGTYSS